MIDYKNIHWFGLKVKMVNIDDTKTWRKFNKTLCDSCVAHCCTLVVEVKAKDLIKLELTSEWEIENDLKGVVKSLKKQRIIKRYNEKRKMFVLQSKSNGDCIFLNNDRRCSMYEKRPEVCRLHPVELSSKKGFCPYENKESVH